MTVKLRFISEPLRRDIQRKRFAAIELWRIENGWKSGDEGPAFPPEFAKCDPFWLPGMIWECPWYFDPANPEHAVRREKALARPESDYRAGNPNRFLSLHYWRDWSHLRPPLNVVCPNGAEWMVDQVSSNGTGWSVTGEPANLTCSPSIAATGYHGFLQGGQFTADCERPHAPNGIYRDGSPA